MQDSDNNIGFADLVMETSIRYLQQYVCQIEILFTVLKRNA